MGSPAMYVWRQVPELRDYGNGLLCVVAHDLDEAIELAVDHLHARAVNGEARDRTRALLERHAGIDDGSGDLFERVERGAASLRGSA